MSTSHDKQLQVILDEMNQHMQDAQLKRLQADLQLATQNAWTKLMGNPAKWPDHMGQTYYPPPTLQELRDLVAALIWTEGIQSDLTEFLERHPNLRPKPPTPHGPTD